MFGYGFGNAIATTIPTTTTTTIPTTTTTTRTTTYTAPTTQTAPAESYFCPKGGESWCYNPLVMYMRQHYLNALPYGSLDQIRDAFRRSLREAGYVPTSNLEVLITPTGSASAAVHYFQPEVAKVMGGILWEDAKAANASAQLIAQLTSRPIVLRPPVATAPAPVPMIPVPLPATAPAPKPALTLTRLPLMRLPGAAPAAPAELAVPRAGELTLPAEEKKIPWIWIGVGAVVLGGVVLFAMRK